MSKPNVEVKGVPEQVALAVIADAGYFLNKLGETRTSHGIWQIHTDKDGGFKVGSVVPDLGEGFSGCTVELFDTSRMSLTAIGKIVQGLVRGYV